MAQPGWFPDPGGQAGMFRYWDGTAWTDQLSANPGGQPPSGKPGRAGLLIAAIVAVVVVALLAVFFLPRVFGAGPSPSPCGRAATVWPTGG